MELVRYGWRWTEIKLNEVGVKVGELLVGGR